MPLPGDILYPPGEWEPLPLDGTMTTESFGYAPAIRVTGQLVEVRGTVRRVDGTSLPSGQLISMIPPHLRPPAAAYHVAQSTGARTCNIQLLTSGRLEVKSATDPSGGAWLALDGMRWWLS